MAVRPKKILVCYSGSQIAHRALDAAVEQMGYGSRLTVANVAGRGEKTANVVLSEARDVLLHEQVTATYLPLAGDPPRELVGTAAALEADLLVIGACDRNGSAARTLGPVSAEVVERAACDVLVVR